MPENKPTDGFGDETPEWYREHVNRKRKREQYGTLPLMNLFVEPIEDEEDSESTCCEGDEE